MSLITRYCRIKDRTIVRQGEVLHEDHHGSLDDFLDNALTSLSISYPKFYKMDRLSKLGFLATEMLLKDVSLNERYQPQEVALVLSNAHASLDTDKRYFETLKTMASPALFVYTLTNIVMGEICIRHGIKGENAFFVSESFDSEQMSAYVGLVLAGPKTKACIAGWVDVMGEHHDVFLYLGEKQNNIGGLQHTAANLRQLYNG